MACTCPHCRAPLPVGRRAVGYLFWQRWNCGCGARLCWENAKALTVWFAPFVIAVAFAMLAGLSLVAGGVIVAFLATMWLMNRAELVHAEGTCLRCGGPIDSVSCTACGWIDLNR